MTAPRVPTEPGWWWAVWHDEGTLPWPTLVEPRLDGGLHVGGVDLSQFDWIEPLAVRATVEAEIAAWLRVATVAADARAAVNALADRVESGAWREGR